MNFIHKGKRGVYKMSEKKNHLKEIMIWASESPENKKKAIQAFAFAIHTLSNADKKLSEKELEDLAGGNPFEDNLNLS